MRHAAMPRRASEGPQGKRQKQAREEPREGAAAGRARGGLLSAGGGARARGGGEVQCRASSRRITRSLALPGGRPAREARHRTPRTSA